MLWLMEHNERRKLYFQGQVRSGFLSFSFKGKAGKLDLL